MVAATSPHFRTAHKRIAGLAFTPPAADSPTISSKRRRRWTVRLPGGLRRRRAAFVL